MFNNLINIHDIVVLVRKLKERRDLIPIFKLFRSDEDRIKMSWSHTHALSSHWWDIPAVQERWNMLITGSPTLIYQQYVRDRYFAHQHSFKGLSLGCGAGMKEIQWVKTCTTLHLTGIDISEQRIAQAIKNAAEQQCDDQLTFKIESIYDIDVKDHSYDIIIADGALHHFHSLDSLLPKIGHWLKNDGVFIVNDFVGPSRFQWTNHQLEAINGMLSAIPEKFRREKNGRVKKKAYRPGRLSMMISDPSEAVESEKIEELLMKHFQVLERKPYGGTLLQVALKDIAHHFTNEDTEARTILQQMFDEEDLYIQSNGHRSDFMFFVCKSLPR